MFKKIFPYLISFMFVVGIACSILIPCLNYYNSIDSLTKTEDLETDSNLLIVGTKGSFIQSKQTNNFYVESNFLSNNVKWIIVKQDNTNNFYGLDYEYIKNGDNVIGISITNNINHRYNITFDLYASINNQQSAPYTITCGFSYESNAIGEAIDKIFDSVELNEEVYKYKTREKLISYANNYLEGSIQSQLLLDIAYIDDLQISISDKEYLYIELSKRYNIDFVSEPELYNTLIKNISTTMNSLLNNSNFASLDVGYKNATIEKFSDVLEPYVEEMTTNVILESDIIDVNNNFLSNIASEYDDILPDETTSLINQNINNGTYFQLTSQYTLKLKNEHTLLSDIVTNENRRSLYVFSLENTNILSSYFYFVNNQTNLSVEINSLFNENNNEFILYFNIDPLFSENACNVGYYPIFANGIEYEGDNIYTYFSFDNGVDNNFFDKLVINNDTSNISFDNFQRWYNDNRKKITNNIITINDNIFEHSNDYDVISCYLIGGIEDPSDNIPDWLIRYYFNVCSMNISIPLENYDTIGWLGSNNEYSLQYLINKHVLEEDNIDYNFNIEIEEEYFETIGNRGNVNSSPDKDYDRITIHNEIISDTNEKIISTSSGKDSSLHIKLNIDYNKIFFRTSINNSNISINILPDAILFNLRTEGQYHSNNDAISSYHPVEYYGNNQSIISNDQYINNNITSTNTPEFIDVLNTQDMELYKLFYVINNNQQIPIEDYLMNGRLEIKFLNIFFDRTISFTDWVYGKIEFKLRISNSINGDIIENQTLYSLMLKKDINQRMIIIQLNDIFKQGEYFFANVEKMTNYKSKLNELQHYNWLYNFSLMTLSAIGIALNITLLLISIFTPNPSTTFAICFMITTIVIELSFLASSIVQFCKYDNELKNLEIKIEKIYKDICEGQPLLDENGGEIKDINNNTIYSDISLKQIRDRYLDRIKLFFNSPQAIQNNGNNTLTLQNTIEIEQFFISNSQYMNSSDFLSIMNEYEKFSENFEEFKDYTHYTSSYLDMWGHVNEAFTYLDSTVGIFNFCVDKFWEEFAKKYLLQFSEKFETVATRIGWSSLIILAGLIAVNTIMIIHTQSLSCDIEWIMSLPDNIKLYNQIKCFIQSNFNL